MPTLYVRDLSVDARDRLKARAARNRRSVSAEAASILEEAVQEGDLVEERRRVLREIAELRESWTPPPGMPDSAALIREDRER